MEMKLKKFIVACAVGGLSWILITLFLMFLGNTEVFSVIIGIQFAIGIAMSTFSIKKGLTRGRAGIAMSILILLYFFYVMIYLPAITSGRVMLTCMVLILSFMVLQKGFNDRRR